MKKLLYWLVRWPWLAGIIVFLGLTQLPLGPWYVSAWFVIGVTLLVMIGARAERFRLVEALALQSGDHHGIGPANSQDVKVRL